MAEFKRVGNYEILGRIGRGGMGAVFRARQVNMDRVVALKILPPSLAKKPTFIDRFLREARASAKLNHPNIVNGIDVGHQGGLYYFAMEYIEGSSLKSLIEKEERLSEARAVEITRDIALALDHAHTHGILHRDIKPDNVLIDRSGTAKLCDLGLAHLATDSDDEKSLTQDGRAVGTPHYISPEQARGAADLDATTDIYSLGATLYHMLTGTTLFQGSTAVVVMTKHLSEKPVDPEEFGVELSDGVRKILAKLLQKNRSDRYSSAKKLADDLDRVLRQREPKFADLPDEKWPFKHQSSASGRQPAVATMQSGPARKAIIPGSQLERSSHNLRLARRSPRSSSESSVPVGAFLAVGVLLAGALVFMLTASDSEPKAKASSAGSSTPTHAQVALAETHREAPPASPAPAHKPEPRAAPPREEPKEREVDVVGVAQPSLSPTLEALATIPKSRVAGDAYIDPPPGIDPPAILLPPPIQKALSDARVALNSKSYPAVLTKLEQIRSDYAGTAELSDQAAELARIEKAAKDGEAGIDPADAPAKQIAEAKLPEKADLKTEPKKETKPEAAKIADAPVKIAKPEPKTFSIIEKTLQSDPNSSSASSGAFTTLKGELYYAGSKSGCIDFQYQPPEEFDFKIVFRCETTSYSGSSARLAPYGYVLQYVPIGSKSLVWYLPFGSSGYYAFDNIHRTRFSEASNPTRHEYPRLKAGQEYTAVIKVRRDLVTASIDGAIVTAWRRDGVSPTTDAEIRLSDSHNVGVGAVNRINLHVLEASVTEIPTEVANRH